MNTQDTSILDSGQRVGLAVAPYQPEIDDFGPLKAANGTRAALVAAIESKGAAQDTRTQHTTTTKDAAREQMAVATATLSARAVGYALSIGDVGLKQAFTLSYTDVRFGEATEDVNHVRALVQQVQALPAQVRKDFRLTDAIIQAPADAAQLFEDTADEQTDAKAAPHLATLALPELLRRLSAALLLMQTLIAGQATDPDPRWAALNSAFKEANERREAPKAGRPQQPTDKPRIVRTLQVRVPDGRAVRLHNTNYAPAYTLTVENRSAHPLSLWMAQKDGAATTPQLCPAGQITVLTRHALGPETARYLTGQFGGAGGGEATVVVRRVV